MYWEPWEKKQCQGNNRRLYSSKLMDISGDWDNACNTMATTINGKFYSKPTRCIRGAFNTGIWGEFDDVPDDDCKVKWSEPWEKKECQGNNRRLYSSKLLNSVNWDSDCNEMSTTINGKLYNKPSRCVKNSLGVWGEFDDVPDDECKARWGSWKKDGCTDNHHRQYSSILYNIPNGKDWDEYCKSSPVSVEGVNMDKPHRCKNTGLNEWGEVDVPDESCAPQPGIYRSECAGVGVRRFFSKLTIGDGLDWNDSCIQMRNENPRRTIQNLDSTMVTCEAKVDGEYGTWEANDVTCTKETNADMETFKDTVSAATAPLSALINGIVSGGGITTALIGVVVVVVMILFLRK